MELPAEFGKAIAAVVIEVTDDKALPKAERKRLQIVACTDSKPPRPLVKLADKICNLRDLAINPPARLEAAPHAKVLRLVGNVIE